MNARVALGDTHWARSYYVVQALSDPASLHGTGTTVLLLLSRSRAARCQLGAVRLRVALRLDGPEDQLDCGLGLRHERDHRADENKVQDDMCVPICWPPMPRLARLASPGTFPGLMRTAGGFGLGDAKASVLRKRTTRLESLDAWRALRHSLGRSVELTSR